MPGANAADLVLLRHGIAEPRQAGQDHPDRPLTAAGRRSQIREPRPGVGAKRLPEPEAPIHRQS